MEISLLDSNTSTCEEFVQRQAGAKLCHMPVWNSMVQNVFNYRGYYLVAWEDGRICGVLPMCYVRSRLFGSRLVSQPFSDYGGALVTNQSSMEALYQWAVEIALECRCESMELRNTIPLEGELYTRTDKISMYLPLESDPQSVWKGLRHKTRNRIRRAEKMGLTVISGGRELLNEFYRVWTIRMRELGTPCYPRLLFRSILRTFPGASRIFLAVANSTTVAGLFAYTFKDWVQCCWGAALREYDALGPNYLVNWAAIEYYCIKGMKWFDFGRSTIGSGQHTFKERWGATPIDLYWQYWTPPGQKLRLVTREDKRYQRKVRMWRRLPLSVTRAVGPRISRGLP